MSCDHKWGNPEYSKIKTDYYLGKPVQICDMCKAVIVDNKTVTYEEVIIVLQDLMEEFPEAETILRKILKIEFSSS